MVELRGVAKVGELINFEACMEIMDLLYEKEETSFLYRSPHSLAASILVICTFVNYFHIPNIMSYKLLILESCDLLLQVVSYVMTVPKQKWEFPILAWGKKLNLVSNILFSSLIFNKHIHTTT
jgi:hypothetical protein